MDKNFYKMTFQKMDDGIGAIHRGVIYGYFTISNDKILWNPMEGHNICLELLQQVVNKMEKLQAEADLYGDSSCGM